MTNFAKKLSGGVPGVFKFAAVVFVIWYADYWAVQWGYRPWCTVEAMLRPALSPLASLAILCCCGYLAYALIRHGPVSAAALKAVALLVLIGGAEGYCRILFNFGGACG